jgi:peptidoglycan hydrolase-like protein with peptidoglycan-binding domain
MTMTRTLRLGCTGEDVAQVKQRLFELGCYEPRIAQLTSATFGSDTRNAVKAFQQRQGLVADGVVGVLTYAALFPQESGAIVEAKGEAAFAQLGESALAAILSALESVNATRRNIVLDALQFAIDPAKPDEFPTSLYIRGGNLYNADLMPNVITIARIQSGAKRQPEFYDGGRQEMMERAVLQNPAITGADCSGGVVGLLRHAKVVKPDFDLSADGFAAQNSIRTIAQAALLPADLLHKSGHIGLYAGGGYAVEWMGGAYGCQLTRVANRRGWNFVKRKEERFGAWTSFLRPSWY